MMKKLFATITIAVFVLDPHIGLALERNQVRYRSAIISVFPDGYSHSLEDLLDPFQVGRRSKGTSPRPIHITANHKRIKITYMNPGDDQEKVFKTGVRLENLRTEVDRLINRFEGIRTQETLAPTAKKPQPLMIGDANQIRKVVYKNTEITIKGPIPSFFTVADDGSKMTNTTTVLVVFRNNKGSVYYRRQEDGLLRSINKNMALDEVQLVLDSFLNAL